MGPSEGQVVARCRAKLNLVLEILGKRPDGYHEIATIMHPIELADTVTVKLGAPGIALETRGLPSPEGEDNIAMRAARAFYAATGCPAAVEIVLEKRIPAQSGLGGGSSNAAGVLMALRALHRVPADGAVLAGVARDLGADVPFFLGPGAALAEGIGDRLTSLPACQFWVVLALGRPGVSTQWAYGRVGPEHHTDGARARGASLALRRSGAVDEVWNGFMPALARERPDLPELAAALSGMTGGTAALTGSGSCVYAMAPDERTACAARDALAAEGYWSWSGGSARQAVSLAGGHSADAAQGAAL